MNAQGLVPQEYTDDHVLVVPRAADDVPARAAAWFSGVRWVREAKARQTGAALVGARFRGVPRDETQPEPGILALGDARAVGPFEVTAAQASALSLRGVDLVGYALRTPVERGLPATTADADGLGRVFPEGLPVGRELGMLRWGVAVARALHGALVTSAGQVLRPDPSSVVDLTLFSAHPLRTAELLPLLRKVVPGARVVGEWTSAEGTPSAQLVGESQYDGAIQLDLSKVAEVPRALDAVPWREYGPYSYRVRWVPVDEAELGVDSPSGTHVIARTRMRSVVARLTESLERRVGGVVVDEDGFVVDSRALRVRGVEVPSGRMWL
ncbi:hypothetical protein SAMN04489860_0057 [Paraoerskovia marina]|uniref:Uncharacterized protein n=1 Tax=Paraoerskovia marina TaxID=545619 RepID=A0A1H1LYU0_9CELL|nr:hypothetical protein [Paraoerskovia marina]SDR78949.1 hypothetical protein SAMN04489860_0057 [Paraoerskovia marina]